MLSKRLIARLDIKGLNVVKGIHFEGLRVMGDPITLAKKYQGASELLYIDTVASLYGRNQLTELLRRTSDEVFIPITVGGGIGSCDDVTRMLNAGADKCAINTRCLSEPTLISRIADEFGSQTICVSIQCKRYMGGWEAYTECGRERTYTDALEWAEKAVALGAGELLITSIDQDGTMKGFDTELMDAIDVSVPVIACGGLGKISDLSVKADAIACASVLHHNKLTIGELHDELNQIELPSEERRATG